MHTNQYCGTLKKAIYKKYQIQKLGYIEYLLTRPSNEPYNFLFDNSTALDNTIRISIGGKLCNNFKFDEKSPCNNWSLKILKQTKKFYFETI